MSLIDDVPFETGRLDFDYEGRISAVVQKLGEAGVDGGERLRLAPAGWIGILEALANDLAALPGHIQVQHVREKYGLLRVVIVDLESRTLDERAMAWCEEQSERRCMVFGTPGRLRNDMPWVMTISEKAHAMRQKMDSAALRALIYPVSRR